MKVILTGSTGFIGSEVLAQCLNNPVITSIVALSRRELPDAASNAKVKVVIMEDFAVYSDSVLEEMNGADGCIWCMGTFSGDRVVEIDYPLAFANAMAKIIPAHKKKFRYVYLGGALTEPDQEKRLWYLQTARRFRGLAETKVQDLPTGEELQGLWETVVVKPGGVLAKDGYMTGLLGCIVGSNLSIRIDELAATMIDVVRNGSENPVLLNRVIAAKGRELLRKTQ
ncbi:hypothetical protein MMC20_005791 [Loxospora ochrophaea]|nr:hypothetical protein [Loxospora ochrophaea]